MASTDIYTSLYERQKLFYNEHITREIPYRLTALDRLREGIEDHEQDFTEALNADLGKSAFESYTTEIGIVLNEIRYVQRHLRQWTADRRLGTPLALFGSCSKIHYEPRGVILIIAPWNYPLQLTLTPLVGAIAAGCCAVVKPSAEAPQTAHLLQLLIKECFEDEYIAVTDPDNEVTAALLDLPWNHIFYTGGEAYGREVMAKAAARLTPVTLELGGKSPCIVDADADIRIAAQRIVWGKFLNCGQTCVAPDYLFVHRSIKKNLLEAIRAEIQQQFGDTPQQNPDYPRIVNSRHFDRLAAMLKDGHILIGGQHDKADRYIAPTLIDEVKENSGLLTAEIFGPILPVIPFDDLDDCVEYVNSRPTPLALYYFTSDKKKARYMVQHTESGGVCINDTVIHTANNRLPFGGVGASGIGAYHGKYSFETFSHAKPVMTTTARLYLDMKCAPYAGKLKWIKYLLR